MRKSVLTAALALIFPCGCQDAERLILQENPRSMILRGFLFRPLIFQQVLNPAIQGVADFRQEI